MSSDSKPILKKAYVNALRRNLGEKEAKILMDFVETNTLEGEFYTRVPLCDGHIRIDALCVEGVKSQYPISVYGKLKQLRRLLLKSRRASAWVLEIKEKLNFEALGQILVDMYYFPKEYSNIAVKGYGILCEESDEALEAVCKHHRVKVFKIR